MNFPNRFRLLAKNLSLNGASTALRTLILQLLVLPIAARQLSVDTFGQILIAIAIINTFSTTIGSALANAVLQASANTQKTAQHLSVDYSLFNTCLIAGVLLTLILSTASSKIFSFDHGLLVATIASIRTIGLYLMVEHRLNLDYSRVAIYRVTTSIGYLCGLGVILIAPDTLSPLLIFLIGESLGLGIALLDTTLLEKGYSTSKEVLRELKRTVGFSFSILSNNLVSYGDRFIISSFISLSAVPVFFSAAVGGRLLQLGAANSGGVILSHLVRSRASSLRKRLSVILAVSAIFGLVTFIILQAVTPWLIQLLYPKFSDSAVPVLGVVNAGFGCRISAFLIRPLTIRLIRVRKIVFLDGSMSVLYLCCGAVGALIYGLEGFCVAFAAVSGLKIMTEALLLFSERGIPSN